MGFLKDLIYNYNKLLKQNEELGENREISLMFLRFCSFTLNFIFLALILDINIFITIAICYFINWFIWNLSTTWFVVDFIQGLIIYREHKYIKKNIYIKIITIIDIIAWIKTQLKSYKYNIELKKIDKVFLKNLFYSYLYYTYMFYYKLTNIIWFMLKNKKFKLNYFWEKLNFNKIYLKNNKIYLKNINNNIENTLNKLIECYITQEDKETMLNLTFKNNNTYKLNFMWNKKNIIIYYIKLFILWIKLVFIDLKYLPKFILLYTKLILFYFFIIINFLKNNIFNIYTYKYIYIIYIYIYTKIQNIFYSLNYIYIYNKIKNIYYIINIKYIYKYYINNFKEYYMIEYYNIIKNFLINEYKNIQNKTKNTPFKKYMHIIIYNYFKTIYINKFKEYYIITYFNIIYDIYINKFKEYYIITYLNIAHDIYINKFKEYYIIVHYDIIYNFLINDYKNIQHKIKHIFSEKYIYIIIYNYVNENLTNYIKNININTYLIYIKNIKLYNLNIVKYIKNINYKKLWLEILVYYVNKKRPWKQFKYDKSLYIIKYLDGLEYAMLTHKKYYKHKNIVKFHKKKYLVKKIPSNIEKKLKLIKLEIYNNYIKFLKKFNFFKNLIINLINIIKINKINLIAFEKLDLLPLDYTKLILNIIIIKIIPINLNKLILKYENFIIIHIYKLYNIYLYNIKFIDKINTINIKQIYCENLKEQYIQIYIKHYKYNLPNIYLIKDKFKEPYINIYINYFIKYTYKHWLYIYTPFIIINYIISDICLSITYFKYKKYKKYKKIKSNLFNKFMYIKIKIKKLIKFIKQIISYITLIISKTIYLIFLASYFFNKRVTEYLHYNFLNNYNIFRYKLNDLITYIIINKNIMFVLITIIGLTLTIKWSRSVHKFFGNYLWTMTIFPIFLDSHKVLYLKLISINIFNYNKVENLILFKLDFIYLLNYKFYNIYNLISIIIILFFIIYTIKHGGFRTVYANLKATRWKFIKYPLIILLIELLRYKIIELLSILILYINTVYKLQYYIIHTYIFINNLSIVKIIYYLINRFLITIEKFDFYILYYINIPNLYLLNFLIDLLLAYICLTWLLKYLNTFVKSDKKYVAFPLVTSEYIYKYIIYFYIIYYNYFLLYSIATNPNGKIFEYIAIALTWTYIYLEIRVHKIPRKTMPWYFRQIVELWPSTAINIWTTSKALYNDQQKYLSMRKKFKNYKKLYKDNYDKSELWEKKIILAYQRDKEYYLYIFTAFCKLMSRKEKMLKEVNIFDYHGWQQEWTYNYKIINIYTWKIDWWDKPYLYIFKKNIAFTNVRDFYFAYFFILYRFSCKFNWMVMLFWIIKPLEHFYSNLYLHFYEIDDLDDEIDDNHKLYLNIKHSIFYRGRKYKNICKIWKTELREKRDKLENLKKLKRLKKVLMEFSSGKRIKTPDWVFPIDYEKQYKKDGWKMFENPEIDNVELDWRPKFSEW